MKEKTRTRNHDILTFNLLDSHVKIKREEIGQCYCLLFIYKRQL